MKLDSWFPTKVTVSVEGSESVACTVRTTLIVRLAPAASGVRATPLGDQSFVAQLLASPQLPYVGLGLGALAVILAAIAAHLRGRYR